MSTVAVVILMRERRIVDRFRAEGATSPETALADLDLTGVNRLAMRRLQRSAVIRKTPVGALYLDEPSWTALRGMRRRVLGVAITVGLLIALGAYLGWAR